MIEIKVHKVVEAQWPDGPGIIAIVGEAPDETEALKGVPFIGARGQILNKALKDVGIFRAECYVSNVFRRRPPDNKVDFFFVKKGQASKDKLDQRSPFVPFGSCGFVSDEWVGELEKLREDLEALRPNVVIALGATALWALTSNTKIGSYRGTIMESTLVPGLKVVATYHPAAVVRSWNLLPIFVADLHKAKFQAEFPEIRRIVREIYIEPSLDDILDFWNEHITPLEGGDDPLAYDIETVSNPDMITCIGFAPNDRISLVIPFMDKRKSDWCYWPTLAKEQSAWKMVQGILNTPTIPKVAQNGMYDIQWLHRLYGIKVRGKPEDTMLMHHALQPELPKSLGFLGSMYSDEPAWKQLVSHKAEKKDA